MSYPFEHKSLVSSIMTSSLCDTVITRLYFTSRLLEETFIQVGLTIQYVLLDFLLLFFTYINIKKPTLLMMGFLKFTYIKWVLKKFAIDK